MSMMSMPSFEEFLAAQRSEVAKIAPETLIYAVGGTRRHAALEGIEPWSDDFLHWVRQRMFRCLDLIFCHGVRNLLIITFTPDNLKEVNPYRGKLLERAEWVIAGAESLADYARYGWRVRLLGAESVPELHAAAETLQTQTAAQSQQTLYLTVVSDVDSPWQQLLAAAQQAQARTRAAAIRALYGEDIPPATLYLAFGKPMIAPTIIPPLLMGQLQCYWSQQPGYTLTERQLRTVLYDYAYLRPTWQEEKLERAKEALAQRSAWEEGPILGLGMRLGPFWYPAPMSSPVWPSD